MPEGRATIHLIYMLSVRAHAHNHHLPDLHRAIRYLRVRDSYRRACFCCNRLLRRPRVRRSYLHAVALADGYSLPKKYWQVSTLHWRKCFRAYGYNYDGMLRGPCVCHGSCVQYVLAGTGDDVR